MGIRVLRVLVAAVVLTLLFRRIPYEAVLSSMSEARPLWLVGALLASVAGETVASIRLERITRAHGLGLSWPDAFSAHMTARLYSLALPAGNAAGFAVRIHRITGGSRRYADAARSVLFDRVTATTTLAAVGIVGWLVDRRTAPDAAGWAPLLLLLGALGALLTLHRLLVDRGALPGLRGLWRRLEQRWPARFGVSLSSLDPSASRLGWTLRIWAWSLVVHALGVLTLVCVARSLGIGLSAITLLWTRSVAFLITILPISVAGLGVRDGVFVFLFEQFEVPAADALAFSLLAFAITVLGVGLLGGLLEVRRAWR